MDRIQKRTWFGIVFILLLISLLCSCVYQGMVYPDLVGKLKKKDISKQDLIFSANRVKKEDNDYYLNFPNTQGWSISDGRFHLEKKLKVKKTDKSEYYCFISDEILKDVKVMVEYSEIQTNKIENSYHCKSQNNGIEKNRFYCKLPEVYDKSSGEYINLSYYQELPEEYFIEKHKDKTVTLYYNRTFNEIKKIKEEVKTLSSHAKSLTDGNFQNCLYFDFKHDKEYKIDFSFDVDKKRLPIKWTGAFINMNQISPTSKLKIDPTITDSRTWTTDADWNNGTVGNNMTVEDGNIKLTSFDIPQGNIKGNWTLDVDCSDYSGLGHNCTPHLNVTHISSESTCFHGGGCYELGRTSESGGDGNCLYVEPSPLDDYQYGKSYTVCMAIYSRLQTYNGDTFPFIDGGVNRFIYDNNNPSYAEMSYYDGGYNWISSTYAISSNEWIWYCYDYNEATNNLTQYVNGIATGSSTGGGIQRVDQDWGMGSYRGSDSCNDNKEIDGYIDNYILFNVSLTKEQIKDLNSSYYHEYSTAIWSDREGLCPQSSQRFINQTFNFDPSNSYQLNYSDYSISDDDCIYEQIKIDGSGVHYRFNTTNSSLDTSAWITLDGSAVNVTSKTLYEDSAGAPNNAPALSSFEPTNNTEFSSGTTSIILNSTYTDADTDAGTVVFYNASDDSIICENTSVSDSTEVNCKWTGLINETSYQWTANTSDGTDLTNYGDYNFSINDTPIGTLSISWLEPTTDTNHIQNEWKQYTFEVNCTGGGCGNVNVTIDPASGESINISMLAIGDSNTFNYMSQQKVIRDTNEEIHICYRSADDGLYYANSSDGNTWSHTQLLDGSSNDIYGCSIAINSNNELIIVATNQDDDYDLIYFNSSDGSTWSSEQKIPDFNGNAGDDYYVNDIVVDSNDVYHLCVASTGYGGDGSNDYLFYSNYSDGSWLNTKINISTDSTDDIDICGIEVDTNNKVWITGVGGDEYDLDLFDITTKTRRTVFNVTGIEISQWGFEIDKNDMMWWVCVNDTTPNGYIKVINSSDGSTFTKQTLGGYDYEYPTIKITNESDIYVTVTNVSESKSFYFVSTDNGQTWSSRTQLLDIWFYKHQIPNQLFPLEARFTDKLEVIGLGNVNKDLFYGYHDLSGDDSKSIIPLSYTGSEDFWTNKSSNPTDECGEMSSGNQCNVTFYVNATGDEGGTFEFFGTASSDNGDVSSINSSKINITITENVSVTEEDIYSNFVLKIRRRR